MKSRNAHKLPPQSAATVLRDAAIGAAIAHLPQALRWVMILAGRGGLSTNEIATLAGVSPKAIACTQTRGQALIEKELMTGVQTAS